MILFELESVGGTSVAPAGAGAQVTGATVGIFVVVSEEALVDRRANLCFKAEMCISR